MSGYQALHRPRRRQFWLWQSRASPPTDEFCLEEKPPKPPVIPKFGTEPSTPGKELNGLALTSGQKACPFSELTDLPVIPKCLANSAEFSKSSSFVAPYVPCPKHVIEACLDLADVRAEDVVVDLGCGDGRILFACCRRSPPPRMCVGVELDPDLARYAADSVRAADLSGRVRVLHSDMATVHLADLCATVAVLYVLPTGMARQAPVLAKWLRAADPRARVVTIDYSLPGWKPVTGAEVRRPGSKVSRWLFLYDSKSANAAADGAA